MINITISYICFQDSRTFYTIRIVLEDLNVLRFLEHSTGSELNKRLIDIRRAMPRFLTIRCQVCLFFKAAPEDEGSDWRARLCNLTIFVPQVRPLTKQGTPKLVTEAHYILATVPLKFRARITKFQGDVPKALKHGISLVRLAYARATASAAAAERIGHECLFL